MARLGWIGMLLCSACGGPSAAAAPAAATADRDAESRGRCCAQCAAAADRDPTGADISGKTCTSYPMEWNGGPGVDDACRGWFVAQRHSLTVGECRPQRPAAKVE